MARPLGESCRVYNFVLQVLGQARPIIASSIDNNDYPVVIVLGPQFFATLSTRSCFVGPLVSL